MGKLSGAGRILGCFIKANSLMAMNCSQLREVPADERRRMGGGNARRETFRLRKGNILRPGEIIALILFAINLVV